MTCYEAACARDPFSVVVPGGAGKEPLIPEGLGHLLRFQPLSSPPPLSRVAALPRTGLLAPLQGLGAVQPGPFTGDLELPTSGSPVCWAPHSCSWPCSQGPPPCLMGHLVCRGWCNPGPSCCHSLVSFLTLTLSVAPGDRELWWALLYLLSPGWLLMACSPCSTQVASYCAIPLVTLRHYKLAAFSSESP
jgi:hypothetical protein